MQVQIFNETLKNIWQGPPDEISLVSQQIDAGLQQKMLSIFSLGDYYSFVFNLNSMEFTRQSCGVELVLGYKPEEFTSSFAIEHIHPDDRAWVMNAENTIKKFYQTLAPENFFNYKVRYDYRMQKKSGKYVRILQQVVVVNYSLEGVILDTFCLHTDISHLKSSNSRNLSFVGLNGTESLLNYPVEDISEGFEKHFFSKREREILCHLWEGR
ncbi:MAG: PAS domain-containing protein, partial [Salinivirgaceae bacterium]